MPLGSARLNGLVTATLIVARPMRSICAPRVGGAGGMRSGPPIAMSPFAMSPPPPVVDRSCVVGFVVLSSHAAKASDETRKKIVLFMVVSFPYIVLLVLAHTP